MNILFLDFDGVFLTSRTKFQDIDFVATNFIAEMCNKHNIKIVVSSTHRMFNDCFDTLEQAGLSDFVFEGSLWKTPRLNGKKRGHEIDDWLSKHNEVRNFIILDDDDDMLQKQRKFLVKTSSNDGILTRHMLKFEDIIEKEWNK